MVSTPRIDDDERARALLTQLTLDEKLSLLAGQSFWKTRAVPRVSLAPMRVTDGPRGVGYHSAWRRCTAFPTGIALGASWDPDLAREFGEALARETAAVGAHVVLGPAVNICRTPLNGRTFEYFTEDPELNARLAVACVQGIQSQGVAACIKHYAANNQETNRTRNSSQLSERALDYLNIETTSQATYAVVGVSRDGCYRLFAPAWSKGQETAVIAEFAEEEQEHLALLEKWQAKVPATASEEPYDPDPAHMPE